MDKSSVYIAMCCCPELQEMLPLSDMELEDYIAVEQSRENEDDDNTGKFIVGRLQTLSLKKIEEDEIEDFSIHLPSEEVDMSTYPTDYWFIKLFCQDEIQKMIREKYNYSTFKLIVEFNYFFLKEISGNNLTKFFDTIEKCWLAYYMYIIHKKVWMGKSWSLVEGYKCRKILE